MSDAIVIRGHYWARVFTRLPRIAVCGDLAIVYDEASTPWAWVARYKSR